MMLRDWLLRLDRWCNARLGGLPDQTMSQTVGFEQLAGVEWWARPVALILEVINLERHHCIRALYGDEGRPIWPDRMPPGAPKINPYPDHPNPA